MVTSTPISYKSVHNYIYFHVTTWHKVLKVASGNNHFLKKAIIVSHYSIIYKHSQHKDIYITFHPFSCTMQAPEMLSHTASTLRVMVFPVKVLTKINLFPLEIARITVR